MCSDYQVNWGIAGSWCGQKIGCFCRRCKDEAQGRAIGQQNIPLDLSHAWGTVIGHYALCCLNGFPDENKIIYCGYAVIFILQLSKQVKHLHIVVNINGCVSKWKWNIMFNWVRKLQQSKTNKLFWIMTTLEPTDDFIFL